MKTRKASIILLITGIILGAIYLAWSITQLPPPPPEVDWSAEANEYLEEGWMAKVYVLSGMPGTVVPEVVEMAKTAAALLANGTDKIIHLIDLRTGMLTVWMDEYPDRYPTWATAWKRLRDLEEEAGYAPPVSWSDEAFAYYNPFQSNCTAKVLHLESGGNTTEFRDMFKNVTVKAEEIAADDGVVDLIDLRTAIATVLQETYPDTYPTIGDAWTRLENLEGQVSCP